MKIKLILIVLILGITFWVYLPGISGGFIFDDYYNLETLDTINHEISAQSLKEFLAYSHSGPLKRPVSMLSFLLDGQTWPTDAAPFKRTNIMIHLLIGLSLFFLTYRIMSIKLSDFYKAASIAFFATAIWLLHPLFVSTTLYVIQRMAMLPGLFIVTGLYFYLRIRQSQHSANDYSINKFLLLALVIFVFTSLAVLSKENGILLLFIFPLFELYICRNFLLISRMPPSHSWILVRAPVLFLLLLLLLLVPGFVQGYETRPFSMDERVLTQFRVLTMYLKELVLPNYMSVGIFGNWIQISKNLLNPISTLFSLVFISSLITMGFLLRKKMPLLGFAVIFYFLAQLLESSIVPLDMYYEHRNYVSSMFIFTAAAYYFYTYINSRFLQVSILLSVLLTVTFLTHLRVQLWSDNVKLHALTVEKFPESSRARGFYAFQLSLLNRREESLSVLEQAYEDLGDLEFKINQYSLKCVMNRHDELDFKQLSKDISDYEFTKGTIEAYIYLINLLNNKNCSEQDNENMIQLIESFVSNETVMKSHFNKVAFDILAKISFRKGNLDQTLNFLTQAFDNSHKSFDQAVRFLIEFISYKEYELADQYYQFISAKAHEKYKYRIDWFGIEDALQVVAKLLQENKDHTN